MQLTQIVEALILAAEEPLDSEAIRNAIHSAIEHRQSELETGEHLPDHLANHRNTTTEMIDEAIDQLNAGYQQQERALVIHQRPKGWRIMTRPEFADYLHALFPERRSTRLSGPALETLAIVAYRQPVTKAEIESVRGVSVDGMIQKLLDLELIKIGGRAELPGRPLFYTTTDKFLEHFNLPDIEDLPNANELRRAKFPDAKEANQPEETSDQNNATPAEDAESTEPSEPAQDAQPGEDAEDAQDAEPSESTEPADHAEPAEPAKVENTKTDP